MHQNKATFLDITYIWVHLLIVCTLLVTRTLWTSKWRPTLCKQTYVRIFVYDYLQRLAFIKKLETDYYFVDIGHVCFKHTLHKSWYTNVRISVIQYLQLMALLGAASAMTTPNAWHSSLTVIWLKFISQSFLKNYPVPLAYWDFSSERRCKMNSVQNVHEFFNYYNTAAPGGSRDLTYVPGHGIPFARALDYGK